MAPAGVPATAMAAVMLPLAVMVLPVMAVTRAGIAVAAMAAAVLAPAAKLYLNERPDAAADQPASQSTEAPGHTDVAILDPEVRADPDGLMAVNLPLKAEVKLTAPDGQAQREVQAETEFAAEPVHHPALRPDHPAFNLSFPQTIGRNPELGIAGHSCSTGVHCAHPRSGQRGPHLCYVAFVRRVLNRPSTWRSAAHRLSTF